MSDDKGMKLEEARIGNVLTSKPSASGSAEQYYAYMLRQEKLKNLGGGADGLDVLDENEIKSLRGVSDLDQLELKALARLYQLSDNSPELLQYFAITKSGTREEVAKKLAKKQLRKQLVEEAVQKVLPSDKVLKIVEDTLKGSRANRGKTNGFGIGELTFKDTRRA
jgi:hypothetical protein